MTKHIRYTASTICLGISFVGCMHALGFGPKNLGRNLLLRFGVFGNDAVSVNVKLARAYNRFRRWTAQNKIECSQPAFTDKMET